MSKPPKQHDNDIILPLSLSQNQVWLDQQTHPDSTHLNLGGFGYINGQLDLTLFTQALQQVTLEHQALRLLPLNDAQQQLIECWDEPLLEFHDLSSSDNGDNIDDTIHAWWQKAISQPYVLGSQQRPWSVALFKINEQRYAIIVQSHHLVLDGYSVVLMMQHFTAAYRRLINPDSPNAIASGDYRQFIEESTAYGQSDRCLRDGQYWQSVLPTLPPLMLEKRHPQTDSTSLASSHNYRYSLTSDQYQQLKDFAKPHGTTMYHLYIAALAIYFGRTCFGNHFHREGECDIVFGVPVLNRGGKRYKTTLGMFVVVVPLSIKLKKTDTIASLLTTIKTALRGAYRHARYPFNMLATDLQMIRHGQETLFDVLLSYELQDFHTDFDGAQINEIHQLFNSEARYPLAISICEFHDEEPTEIIYESDSEYFNHSETELTARRLQHLLMQMVNHPDTTVDLLPLLSTQEHHELIVREHQHIAHHPNPPPFICDFEHQAALRPGAIAIHWQAQQHGPISNINYATLNQQANRLAHRLIELGVKKDDIVAVIMPRQLETYCAYLAIAKAGAAFVPLAPDAPVTRLLRLIKTSGAAAIVTGQACEELLFATDLPWLIIDNDDAPQHNPALATTNPDILHQSSDLAYVLFTSGSTGTPKGVLMEHGPLTRRLAWLARSFAITAKDIALQSIQLTFDPAIIEIFSPLTLGASIALPPPGKIAPTDIAHYAEAFGATNIIFVPTTLRYFNQTAKNHPNLKLRVAISGGEVLPRALAQQFTELTGAQLFNFYGPTEACVFATTHRFDQKDPCDPLPIGNPVDDTQIYILDANLQPLPWGAVGEIFIGGHGLARGYLTDATNNKSSQQRFIADPFVAGQRMYHSGDNGYRDEAGRIHFVGRIDNQIKLRGQRIEPCEIENGLNELPGIGAAAVKMVNNELHAWVVLSKALTSGQNAGQSSGQNPKPNIADVDFAELQKKLSAALRHKLPDYMVPVCFTPLTAMPRQSSSKVDYQALKPADDFAHQNTDRIVAPRTNLEKLLLNLFVQILALPCQQNLKQQTINQDFFAAGGDSIKALNLLSQIDKQIGQRLPLSLLLKNPTVAQLATAIVQRHQPLMVNLSEHQQGNPIYLAASGHGDALRFMPLAEALGADSHLHMLQPPIGRGYATYNSIGELAEYYAALIEQRHHQSPPIIAGFSIGGICALETARRLVGRGVPIGGLVLIDTAYPSWLLRRTRLWRLSGWLVRALRLQELSINQRTLGSLFSDPGLNGQIAALSSYRPAPFSLPTTLLISSGFSRWHRLLFRPWRRVFQQQLTEKPVAGFHGTLFAPEHVATLAEIIRP
ncbi:MAG: amino acid adenylation domain-containing protein [Phenylobacterium sp.]|jgi:amino acid adenylation domain-containing protein